MLRRKFWIWLKGNVFTDDSLLWPHQLMQTHGALGLQMTQKKKKRERKKKQQEISQIMIRISFLPSNESHILRLRVSEGWFTMLHLCNHMLWWKEGNSTLMSRSKIRWPGWLCPQILKKTDGNAAGSWPLY